MVAFSVRQCCDFQHTDQCAQKWARLSLRALPEPIYGMDSSLLQRAKSERIEGRLRHAQFSCSQTERMRSSYVRIEGVAVEHGRQNPWPVPVGFSALQMLPNRPSSRRLEDTAWLVGDGEPYVPSSEQPNRINLRAQSGKFLNVAPSISPNL